MFLALYCCTCLTPAELTQCESAEKCVYSRIGHVINTFHELLQTALPVGGCIDALMRVVYRLYLLLTTLVKWVSLHGHHCCCVGLNHCVGEILWHARYSTVK